MTKYPRSSLLASVFVLGLSFTGLSAQQSPVVVDQADTTERAGVLLDRLTEQPVTGTVVARHPNGQLKLRYGVVDGRADGAWLEWFEEGTVRLYAEWKQGLGDGVWVYFHPNGEVSERAQVRDDIWDGVAEGWHDNGVKAFESRLDRGVRLEPVRRWDRDGAASGPWISLLGSEAPRAVLAEGWPAERALWDFSFSPDLETVFIATGLTDGTGRQVLVRRWRGGVWTTPEAAPFADPSASEGTPSVSPDGRHVYFSSDRHRSAEPENPNRDLYRASAASGWRTVERVTKTPSYGEISLSMDTAGRGVLWTDRRVDGDARMGLYEVQYDVRSGSPLITVVGGLNDLHRGDPANENSAAISRDGRAVIFANYNVEDDGSGEDLYLVCRSEAGWSLPVPLSGGVNTQGTESSPQFLGQGTTLAWRYEGLGEQGIRIAALQTTDHACDTHQLPTP